MELPLEILESIVGTGAAIPTYADEQERRRNPRIPFGTRGTILPLFGDVAGTPILVRDISRTDIGFLSAEPLEFGDEFAIHLPRPDQLPIAIHCIVNRCEPGGEEKTQFVIGATFEMILESFPVVLHNDAPPNESAVTPNPSAPPDAAEPGPETATAAPTESEPRADGFFHRLKRIGLAMWMLVSWPFRWNRQAARLNKRLKPDKKSRSPTTTPEPMAAHPRSIFIQAPAHPVTFRPGGLFKVDTAPTSRTPVEAATPPAQPATQPAPAPPAVIAPMAPAPATATPEPIMPATSADIPTTAANPAPTSIAPIEAAPAPVAAAADAPVVAPAVLPMLPVETMAAETPSPVDVPANVIVPTEPEVAPAVEVPAATAAPNAEEFATPDEPAKPAMATNDPSPAPIARSADPTELLRSEPPPAPPAKPLIKPPTEPRPIAQSSDQRPAVNASIAIKVNSTQVMEFSFVLPPGVSMTPVAHAEGAAARPAGSGIGPSRSEQARNARRRREQLAIKRKSPQPNRRTRQTNRHFIN